jgi:Glyoxalase-like domain
MPSVTQCPLDHAVISVRNRIDEAAAIFRRMGFTLTERSVHIAGSCNHLMVFERDYLELLGFPPAGQSIRPDLLDAPIGLDGLVLQTHDARGVHHELVTRGFPVTDPQGLARKLTLPGSTIEQEARFTTVRFPRGAMQGGRVYYCQHETPHLVWHPPFQSHRNGATAIVRFTVVVPDPTKEIIQYETMLGATARSSTRRRACIALGHAQLELVTAAALIEDLGSHAADGVDHEGRPRNAYMAMLTIKVRDLHHTASILRAGGFSPVRLTSSAGTSVAVPASEAMDCTIAFVE